jgi:hyperosmotically inducible periplasmic protein
MSYRIHRWSRASIVAMALLAISLPALAAARPDAWITTKTKIALLTTEGVSGTAIHVDTTDGRVTVHGTVDSEREKAKAAEVARGIEGVREVRNLLQVVPKKMQEGMKVSDSELSTRVTAALDQDKSLKDSQIRVKSVNAGVVLLEGNAKTLSDHQRAIEDAARVDGTVRVESSIKSPDQLADSEIWHDGSYDTSKAEGSAARDIWITTAAKLRLMANSETPALDINVDTDDGIVTLFGTVPSEKSKQTASDVVRKVGGVRSVDNELQIVAAKDAKRVAEKDGDIKSAIEKRLGARGDLESADIDVAVSSGVARLTGSVNTQVDRITAITVTRGTTGVRAVLDELELNPPAVSSR